MLLSLALLLAAAQPPDKSDRPPSERTQPTGPVDCRVAPPPPAADARRIANLLAATNGATAETAFHVRSVREEYQILGALGLCPEMQSLIQQGRHTYDMLSARDPRTGATRELWFDISSFFGHEF
jgi:hypothetical protein